MFENSEVSCIVQYLSYFKFKGCFLFQGSVWFGLVLIVSYSKVRFDLVLIVSYSRDRLGLVLKVFLFQVLVWFGSNSLLFQGSVGFGSNVSYCRDRFGSKYLIFQGSFCGLVINFLILGFGLVWF